LYLDHLIEDFPSTGAKLPEHLGPAQNEQMRPADASIMILIILIQFV